MGRATKTGSSRRKGDEFQDLTALQLALELYIAAADFELFIEYEHAGSLDDVVVLQPARVDAYQAKHAVDAHTVYVVDDFINPDSTVFVRKFSDSWKALRTQFPTHSLVLHLRSNRGLDRQLGELIDNSGYFDPKFRTNRYRKEKGRFRKQLKELTGLGEAEFQDFLNCLHFDLQQPSWKKLEEHIQSVLLDHRLGITDRRIFSDLKSLVEKHAIEVADAITPQLIDSFFREIQRRYLLPQVFPVDEQRFVTPPGLEDALTQQLTTADGEYVVVTGPPGSGKSTGISEYFDSLEKKGAARYEIARYYCFVRVHDNQQRQRLEAKSLRVNLLTALQRNFPTVLDGRQFDFSEHRFYQSLTALGAHCQANNKKLVVFLDGLDHAERDATLRDTIIEALPNDIPSGVIFVIGTQELHNWRPLALREGRAVRHVAMPLFSRRETELYVTDRCGIAISNELITSMHEKSGGLPLYLHYLSEMIAESESAEAAIQSSPPSVQGDIRSYYEMLWAAFDSTGKAYAKYLSSVLCGIRFSIHQGELFDFQDGISERPRFEEALREVRHLLRDSGGLLSVFHNSFRVFVLERTDEGTKQEIAKSIHEQLQKESLASPRWFRHALSYALEAGAYEYVLGVVNRSFVDKSLAHSRPQEEIEDAIECGILAAGTCDSLIALARLASLKFRTHERLEFEFSWSTFSDILVFQGRIDQALDSVVSKETGALVLSDGYALNMILRLHETGRRELSHRLFQTLLESFRGNGDLGKAGVIAFAMCAGLLKLRATRVLRWLARANLHPDSLEPEDLASDYSPHYEAYIDGVVQARRDRLWQALKRLDSPFPNELTRYFIIRAVAKHRETADLRSELEEYLSAYPHETNVELGYFAVKAKMPFNIVDKLAGHFELPPERATHQTVRPRLEDTLRRLAYWSVVFGYGQNEGPISQIRARVVGSRAVWACAQAHALAVGKVSVLTALTAKSIGWPRRRTPSHCWRPRVTCRANERPMHLTPVGRFWRSRCLGLVKC